MIKLIDSWMNYLLFLLVGVIGMQSCQKEEITLADRPIAVVLKSIEIIRLSDVPENDLEWDSDDGTMPDIYIEFSLQNGGVLYQSDTLFNVDLTQNNILWSGDDVLISDLTGKLSYSFYDYDPTNLPFSLDDLMASGGRTLFLADENYLSYDKIRLVHRDIRAEMTFEPIY